MNRIIDQVIKEGPPELITGEAGFVKPGEAAIWYERIQTPLTPKGTVLLITGAGGSGFEWPATFIRSFTDAGYDVIRYDQRSTGMSEGVDQWDPKHPYTLHDMAKDAVGILDVLGVERVHISGLSMGGMVAQDLAIHFPERVASLTLIMTSGDVGDPEVPSLSSTFFFKSLFSGLPLLRYRLIGGEKNLVKERIAKTIMAFGDQHLDVKELAEMVVYDLRNRKEISLRGVIQHQQVVSRAGSRYDDLTNIDIPTLVIHGKKDQFFPFEHGEKLAQTIPNAKALWLEGTGHLFPLPDKPVVMETMLTHIHQSERTDRK